MARRRTAALALALFAFALGGCAAAGTAAAPSWHAAAGAGGQGGGTGEPTSAPSAGGNQGGTVTPAGDNASNSPAKLNVISRTGTSAVALTFDDGPGPFTDNILDLLKRYNIKATFCLIGKQVQQYAAEVRRIVAEGHTLCNHTWDHDEKLRNHNDGYIRSELLRTNQAIQAVVPGAQIEYFRNPGGAFGPNTVAIAKSLGMKSLMWNVDPRDWTNPGTQSIISNVLHHTHAGSIVLSHDGGGDRSQTLAAYRVIIPNLRSRFHLIAMPVA